MKEKDFSFYSHTWDRFKPCPNLKLFFEDDVALVYQQKAITFYALAAWLVTGRTRTYTKNAICLGIISAISKAETEAKDRQAAGAAASMLVPLLVGDSFYKNVYWPIGGLKTLSSASSAKRHGEILQKQARILQYSLEMMRVMHIVHELLLPLGRFDLSVSKAAEVVSGIAKIPGCPSKPQLLRQWRRFHDRIALLYAASSVTLDDGSSLLTEMTRHQPRFSRCHSHMEDWLRRASFLLKILKECPEAANGAKSLYAMNKRHMPGRRVTEFLVQHNYSDDELKRIAQIFQKKSGRPLIARDS